MIYYRGAKIECHENYVYAINVTLFTGETKIIMYVKTLERAEIHLKKFPKDNSRYYFINKIHVEN